MNNSTIKSMRLNNDVIEKVKKEANKQNRNFSNMVEFILMDYLKKTNNYSSKC